MISLENANFSLSWKNLGFTTKTLEINNCKMRWAYLKTKLWVGEQEACIPCFHVACEYNIIIDRFDTIFA